MQSYLKYLVKILSCNIMRQNYHCNIANWPRNMVKILRNRWATYDFKPVSEITKKKTEGYITIHKWYK